MARNKLATLDIDGNGIGVEVEGLYIGFHNIIVIEMPEIHNPRRQCNNNIIFESRYFTLQIDNYPIEDRYEVRMMFRSLHYIIIIILQKPYNYNN